MPITVNIAKNSSKVFSVKIDGAMMNNMKQREDTRKPPPDYVGGKVKVDCREQSAVVADEQVADLEMSDGHDSREIWRRSRCVQMAADARQNPWKRGRAEETEGQKNLRGGAGCARFRSGVETRVEKRIRDGGYL